MSSASRLTLTAPMKGDFIPLESVPDPAFAEKMVGDGVAIDPVEGKLFAPCDGEVVMIHPAKHALSLKTQLGVEVLMHIGIDTVKIRGEGFDVKVAQGQQVSAGDLLIDFDIDSVASQAASLITPILITDQEAVAHFDIQATNQLEPGDTLFDAHINTGQSTADNAGPVVQSKLLTVANATGIHARPAAYLVKIAKQHPTNITLLAGQRSANAKSVVAIMGLNIGFADEIQFQTSGADAEQILGQLEQAVISGLGEDVQAVDTEQQDSIEQEPSLLFSHNDNANELTGICASPGFAHGPLFKLEKMTYDYPKYGSDIESEANLFEMALKNAKQLLQQALQEQQAEEHNEQAEILAAHMELLDDPALATDTLNQIEQKLSAPAAWQNAIDSQVTILEGLNNPLMQQRAADLRDVGFRVLRQLLGIDEADLSKLPPGCILATEEMTPSQIAKIDANLVSGVLTVTGSASSHVAIIARSRSIPMLAAVDDSIMNTVNGTDLLVNADEDFVLLEPSDDQVAQLNAKKLAAEALQAKAQQSAMELTTTLDGVNIEVAANLGDVTKAQTAAEQGAEGIGLLRSEFLFLDRVTAPSEDEQVQAYSTLLNGIGRERSAIVRTLDVGGDKPLPYVKIPFEENPFLGERGIRICLDRPHLLRTQFRALLRASPGYKLRIMLPMISSLRELTIAKQVLHEEADKLGIQAVELGVMIEVPSAALMADVLAQEADFFSIGTNDLTQYTLAIDRGNARLASLADNLHPAVLRMIDHTVKGAQKYGRWVGVCGGMAEQVSAQPILVGLGVNELSVSISSIAETKYRVRTFDSNVCRQLAEQALLCDGPEQVKHLIQQSNLLDV
ncbi:phosphoenolpyruvate--protein phosphotransferase [Thalassotalea maritima]|uniref:phosphoenolpyruvate--protein phosphotransferase n=1 Tax=Thalassotalea maritima TaxID=3242416 RepID=UPI0035295E23